MQERLQEQLDRIFQDFKAVNQLKEEIESKEALTDNDKEELEIIQTWVEELQKEINDWAEEYTNEKNTSIEIEETIQPKTLKEQFDENRIKINEIKYQSKSLQPDFKSSNKKNKHEILTSLGFIETKTIDNRNILIHPTLVGQYYDLVKEQRRILDQIKEENKTKAEIEIKDEQLSIKEEITTKEKQEQELNELKQKFDKNQEELSIIMAGKGLGKKDYIKHNGVKYWIAKKYINRFRALMHEQELLSKQLNKIEEQNQEQKNQVEIITIKDDIQTKNLEIAEKSETKEDLFKVINENLNKNIDKLVQDSSLLENNETIEKELPILYQEVIKTTKDDGKIKTKIFNQKNSIIKSLVEKLKNTKFYKKYKEYQEKLMSFRNKGKEENQPKIANINKERKIKKIKEKLATIGIVIAELENITNRTENEEKDLQKLLALKEAEEQELEKLINENQPINEEVKHVRKSKHNIKEKRNKKLKKILVKLAVIAGLTAGIMAGIKSCNKQEQEPIEIERETTVEDQITDEPEKEDQEPELEYFVDDEEYKINGNIYENMYDAEKEINSKTAYFGENTEGHIVGWGIKLNDEMIFVSKYDENYKEKLETLMSQGGQVTTYAMSDTNANQNNEITGFYNQNQIGRTR